MKKKIDLSKYSSIGIGPCVEIKIIDEILSLEKNEQIIGSASNILFSPTPPPLAMLSKKFDYIKIENDQLVIGGATPSGKIISFAKKHNIADFEWIQKIPGTLGGMIKMNAGIKEFEIMNYVSSIMIGNEKVLKKDISYSYRNTDITNIVFEASFDIKNGFDYKKLDFFKSMRNNQPLEKSAGSCFKNPRQKPAGMLLELAALKGYRIGDMVFSDQHANFLINLGNGNFEDAMDIISIAKKRVFDMFGIKLELEIKIL